MIVVLWGVSGCGKTTVGKHLARQLGCTFYDADDFHPPANVDKMRAGNALTDDDRWPWLASIATTLQQALAADSTVVLACSALRQVYRDVLMVDADAVRFVHLSGNYDLIAQRLAERQHEFMSPELLQSQFDTLEVAGTGLTISVEQPVEEICNYLIAELALQ